MDPSEGKIQTETSLKTNTTNEEEKDNEEEEEETESNQDESDKNNFRSNEVGKRRQYLKEIIISHTLWQEGRFWEQALWQCVLEQVNIQNYSTFFELLILYVSYK